MDIDQEFRSCRSSGVAEFGKTGEGKQKTEFRIQESWNEDVCFASSFAGLSSTKVRFRIDNCDLRLPNSVF